MKEYRLSKKDIDGNTLVSFSMSGSVLFLTEDVKKLAVDLGKISPDETTPRPKLYEVKYSRGDDYDSEDED